MVCDMKSQTISVKRDAMLERLNSPAMLADCGAAK